MQTPWAHLAAAGGKHVVPMTTDTQAVRAALALALARTPPCAHCLPPSGNTPPLCCAPRMAQ
jgi:hypothetical protein